MLCLEGLFRFARGDGPNADAKVLKSIFSLPASGSIAALGSEELCDSVFVLKVRLRGLLGEARGRGSGLEEGFGRAERKDNFKFDLSGVENGVCWGVVEKMEGTGRVAGA